MIEVDGSYGEGGGQILRTVLALSAVLGKPVRISSIRAGRPRPGLMAQHLTGIQAAKALCDAEVQGASIGSEVLEFRPRDIRSGRFSFDVGTAGSVTLVLQAVMPITIFAPGRVELEVTGGTDVKWSPPVDYVSQVTLPILERIGCHSKLTLVKRGHYPKGGGRIEFASDPTHRLEPLEFEKPEPVMKTRIVSHVSSLPRHIAQRQAEAAAGKLEEKGLALPEIHLDASEQTRSEPGSGIVVIAETENHALLGGDALGERGVPAEKVGSDAAVKLVEDLLTGAYLDRHMADIMIPYAVLAKGRSRVSIARVTNHVRTNVHVAELLGELKFHLEGEPDKPGRFTVDGLGLR